MEAVNNDYPPRSNSTGSHLSPSLLSFQVQYLERISERTHDLMSVSKLIRKDEKDKKNEDDEKDDTDDKAEVEEEEKDVNNNGFWSWREFEDVRSGTAFEELKPCNELLIVGPLAERGTLMPQIIVDPAVR